MYESFDAFEYIEYLRRRWRVIAAACGVALLVVLPVSLLLPKRYTATASIVIDPPGGSDARIATAVSAVYLESLKTYERYATSDSLFERAIQRFHLDSGSAQSLKRRVLKVSKVRDTKILEISATLPDPKMAQSLAQFLAEETVRTSRGENIALDRSAAEEAESQLREAQTRMEQTQKGWASLASTAPVDSLQSEIEGAVELQNKLRQQLVDAQAEAAEYQQRSRSDGQFAREQLQGAQARAAVIEKRLAEASREIQQKSALLANRAAKRDALQAEMRVAQAGYETVVRRLREIRSAAGTHAEQLRVLDPGVIPQTPSSPNIPLNIVAALVLALVSSIVYLSTAFVYRRKPVGFEPAMTPRMRA